MGTPKKINYAKRICLRCGREYYPKSSMQRYCGSKKERKGCSYKSHKDYEKRFKRTSRCRNTNKKYWHDRGKFLRQQKQLRLRFQILKKYNFACQYCGKRAPEVVLEIDHKYPKSKGGLNEIENYIVACRDCNLGKGDTILKRQ